MLFEHTALLLTQPELAIARRLWNGRKRINQKGQESWDKCGALLSVCTHHSTVYSDFLFSRQQILTQGSENKTEMRGEKSCWVNSNFL